MSILTSVKKINYLNNSNPCNINKKNKKSLYTRLRNNIDTYLSSNLKVYKSLNPVNHKEITPLLGYHKGYHFISLFIMVMKENEYFAANLRMIDKFQEHVFNYVNDSQQPISSGKIVYIIKK